MGRVGKGFSAVEAVCRHENLPSILPLLRQLEKWKVGTLLQRSQALHDLVVQRSKASPAEHKVAAELLRQGADWDAPLTTQDHQGRVTGPAVSARAYASGDKGTWAAWFAQQEQALLLAKASDGHAPPRRKNRL